MDSVELRTSIKAVDDEYEAVRKEVERWKYYKVSS